VFDPKFEITPNLLKYVSRVEAAKAVIENAPLLPLYERKFKAEATVRKVHFSTAIEGNYLNLAEVQKVLSNPSYANDGIISSSDESGAQVLARQRDLNEVINYRNVIMYIESATKSSRKINLSSSHLETLHQLLLKNIMDDVAGKYRTKTAMTVNFATGEKLYPYEEFGNIEVKMRELINWYNNESTNKLVHPVIKAGILHLELVRIHPFEEGNGRLARAIATLSLSVDGYDVGHFFCLDEYYDSNAKDYYDNLSAGFNDLNVWLEYFATGMAVEFDRIKDRVLKISKDAKVKERSGQMFITERQEKIIEWLNNFGYFRNQDFDELFVDISEDTVLRELKGLIDAKIIKKVGKTKSARYELE